jgi:hypothetical protein
MEDEWVLKGCQRTEGDSYVVEKFADEESCRAELKKMQHDWPGHLFWCEVYETRTMDHGAKKAKEQGFWVGD